MRVIKLGGSLLTDACWVETFRVWMSQQSHDFNLLLLGGGSVVDYIRAVDQRFSLTAAAAHWLAIRGMQLHAELAAAILTEAHLSRRLTDLEERLDKPGLWIVDPWHVLQEDKRFADLPISWNVTSDSIAARLAVVLNAQELVLLKSCLPPMPATRESIVATEYVDAYFGRALAGFAGSVRCVDLRKPHWPQKWID